MALDSLNSSDLRCFFQSVIQYLVNSLIGVKWSKGAYQVNGGPGISDDHPDQDPL